jgi:hypothetical protein
MMKKLLMLVFGCLCLLAMNSNAQLVRQNLKDYSEQEIYSATYLACKNLTRQDFQNSSRKLDDYLAGKTASPDFNQILNLIRDESQRQAEESKDIKNPSLWSVWLLESRPFQKALSDCYPADPFSHDSFKALVVLADTAGKAKFAFFVAGIFTAYGGISKLAYRISNYLGLTLDIAGMGLMADHLYSSWSEKEGKKKRAKEECSNSQASVELCQGDLFIQSLDRLAQEAVSNSAIQVRSRAQVLSEAEKEIDNLQSQLLRQTLGPQKIEAHLEKIRRKTLLVQKLKSQPY